MTAPAPQIAAVALSHSPQMAQDTAHAQGGTFRAGFERIAKAVAEYDPTLVLYFGPDHMRALAGIAPCFTLVESATGYGDWGTPAEPYQVPKDLAIALGEHLAAVRHRHRHGTRPAPRPRLRPVHARPVRVAVGRAAHPDRHQLRRPAHRHRRAYRSAGHRGRLVPAQPGTSR